MAGLDPPLTMPTPIRSDLPTHRPAALVLVLVAAALGYAVVRGPAPSSATVALIIGGVIGYGATVVQWYFGSSRSSAAKDATIRAQAESSAPLPAGTASDPLHVEAAIEPRTP